MYPYTMIETNGIWNDVWVKLAPSEKLDAMKKIILDIAEELNKVNEYGIKTFVTEEMLENAKSASYQVMSDEVSDAIAELKRDVTSAMELKKIEHSQEMDEAQKVIRGLSERITQLEYKQ